jgi:hypothetical protein
MESIVYAVDWNLVRENVLSGAAWLGGAGAGGGEVIEQLRNQQHWFVAAEALKGKHCPVAGKGAMISF